MKIPSIAMPSFMHDTLTSSNASCFSIVWGSSHVGGEEREVPTRWHEDDDSGDKVGTKKKKFEVVG